MCARARRPCGVAINTLVDLINWLGKTQVRPPPVSASSLCPETTVSATLLLLSTHARTHRDRPPHPLQVCLRTLIPHPLPLIPHPLQVCGQTEARTHARRTRTHARRTRAHAQATPGAGRRPRAGRARSRHRGERRPPPPLLLPTRTLVNSNGPGNCSSGPDDCRAPFPPYGPGSLRAGRLPGSFRRTPRGRGGGGGVGPATIGRGAGERASERVRGQDIYVCMYVCIDR